MTDTVNLAYSPELEPGTEMHFCPIRQQPIIRSQRVRSIPGFHLLSLGAGREALARGHYDAFGERFSCSDLEYLHVDDKVFICAEDHKAFKNQMSMQYHRYIRYELEERKVDRKRLRERAAERLAASAARAARQQQQPPVAPAPAAASSREVAAAPRVVATAPPASATAAPSSMGAVGAEAINDPYGGDGASGAATATQDPYAIPEDPEPASDAAPAPAAPAPAAAVAPAAVAQAPAATVAAAPKPLVRKAPDPDEDDLYGDVGEEVKRPKQASTYANAIGQMMTDDFDEDE